MKDASVTFKPPCEVAGVCCREIDPQGIEKRLISKADGAQVDDFTDKNL